MNRRLTLTFVTLMTSIPGCSADVDNGNVASESAASRTCSASRGAGVVHRYQKALHDAIAYAEGTENRGADGYNIAFTHRQFGSCARHPNLNICAGSLCSTAAGRYQTLKRTWDAVARGIDAPNFEPENQERAARYLISTVRRVSVPKDRPLSAAEFTNALAKLSYEWASLPPSRYGQPNRSATAMRADYCRNAGC